MEQTYTFIHDYTFVEDRALFHKEKFYKLCNEKDNKFIQIPLNKFDYVKKIISLMDGTRTLVQIQEKMYQETGKKTDVSMLFEILKKNGFIIEDRASMEKNEIDMMTKEVFGIRPKSGTKKIYDVCNNIRKVVIALYLLLFLLSLGVMMFNLSSIYNNSYSLNNVNKFGICMIAMYLSLGLHELSHVMVALAYQKDILSISLNLYIGFLPMIYVRIKGINSLEVGKRLQVILSGIITNLILAVLFIALSTFQFGQGKEILWIIGMCNLYAGLLNFIPFTLTDGYFALSILLNRYDMRNFIWKGFILHNRGKYKFSKKEKSVYLLYTAISLFSIGYIVYHFICWVVDMLKRYNLIYIRIGILALAFFMLACFIQVLNRIRLSKKND